MSVDSRAIGDRREMKSAPQAVITDGPAPSAQDGGARLPSVVIVASCGRPQRAGHPQHPEPGLRRVRRVPRGLRRRRPLAAGDRADAGARALVDRQHARQGLPAARNAGAMATDCDLIALCDDDDEWMPDKLRLQVEAMTSGEDVSAVCWDRRRLPRPHGLPRAPAPGHVRRPAGLADRDSIPARSSCGAATTWAASDHSTSRSRAPTARTTNGCCGRPRARRSQWCPSRSPASTGTTPRSSTAAGRR